MTVVTPSTSTRRERKKEAVRSRIIASAVDLFSQHGIAQVTVDQIADKADVGKGTIYNYFRAKEDIVVAFMTDLEQKVQARLRKLDTAKRPVSAVLTEFIRLQFRMKRPYHSFVRVFLGQMFLHTEQFLPYMVEIQKTMDPRIEALLGGLQRRGAIRQDISLPELVSVFKTMQLGLTALWAVEGPPFRATDRTLEREIELFCNGLETKS